MFQAGQIVLAVRIVAENRLALVAAGDYMIEGARKVDPGFTRHHYNISDAPNKSILTPDPLLALLAIAPLCALHLRLDGSDAVYDLELALPGYVYHRLSLDREKRVMVELRRQELHVIPRDPAA